MRVRWIDERNARAAKPCCSECRVSAVYEIVTGKRCDLECKCHDPEMVEGMSRCVVGGKLP